jgi:general secretion pathway protein G
MKKMTSERVERMSREQIMRALAQPRGMTLVEILIVLTIMASIMGVVGVFAIGAIDRANVKKAQIEIGNLSGFVEQYMIMNSPPRLPESLSDLASGPMPITKKVPQDPWGNDYIYNKTGPREFEIICAGKDGQPGTEDDVSRPE